MCGQALAAQGLVARRLTAWVSVEYELFVSGQAAQRVAQ